MEAEQNENLDEEQEAENSKPSNVQNEEEDKISEKKESVKENENP